MGDEENGRVRRRDFKKAVTGTLAGAKLGSDIREVAEVPSSSERSRIMLGTEEVETELSVGNFAVALKKGDDTVDEAETARSKVRERFDSTRSLYSWDMWEWGTKRKQRFLTFLTLFMIFLIVATSGSAMAASITSASGDTTSPGGTATVSVQADNTGNVGIYGIPDDWSVESAQSEPPALSGPEDDTFTDETAWGWMSDHASVDVSVTFSIPNDATIQTNTLDVEAGATNSPTDTTTTTVRVEGQTSDPASSDVVFDTAELSGIVTDSRNNPVEATVFVDEINTDSGGEIDIVRNGPDNYDITHFDPSTNTVFGQERGLIADDLRNYEGFGTSDFSEISVEGGAEDGVTLLRDSSDVTDPSTEDSIYNLYPIPAESASEPSTDITVTGVDAYGNSGSAVPTGVQIGRTSTANIEIQTEGSDFQVTSLNAPRSVSESETFDVVAEIENRGSSTATQDIEYNLNNNAGENVISDVQSITLGGGETSTVTFSVDSTGLSSGDYTHSVSSGDDSASMGMSVEGSANFDVSIDNTNSPVTEGDTLTVEATIQNTGGQEDSQTVNAELPDVGSDSNTITLDGGSSITETFRIPTGGAVAGDYIISVSTDDGSDSTSVRIEEEVEPANFDVRVDTTNSPVTEGEDLRVDATITNTGEGSDSQRVTAEVPDVDSASETIELDGGSSTTETFTIPTEDGDTGTHSLEISTDDNTDSTSVSIEKQGEPASFDVSVESTNSPVTGGDDLTVDVTVTNTGEQDGTQKVTAEVQGVGSDSERVSLSGGSSTTETLRIPTNTGDDGSYSVSVSTDDDSTSTSVSVSADQPSGDEDDGDTDGTGENTDDGTGTDGDGGTTGGDGTGTTSEDDGNGGTTGGSNDDSTAGNEGEGSSTDGTEEPTDGSNTNWLVYALGAVGLVGGGYGGYRMLSSNDDEEIGGSDRDGTGHTPRQGGSQNSRGADTAPSVDSADEYPSAGSLTYDNIEKVEPIGSGGNADVYKAVAETENGETTIAVKEPRMSGTLHIEKAERIMQEAETWDKLDDHKHIVSVIDYGSEPLPWIAMEYMDGGHMGEVTGELGTDQAIWTAVSVTEGVRHAHQKGIAHLDLKPENVLFRSRQDGWDVPKVADWGLSKHLLEHSKSIEGMSPQYAAPEQFDEEYGTADGVTDVYQLGAVFYDLFTGRPPFEGKPTKVMRAVMDDEPVPPSDIADVPPELDEILMKALEKDKEDRYDNILYLRDDLQDMFE